jgi:hypothetical protein
MLIGLVEEVGASGKKAFNTFDDLWEILNPVKSEGEGGRGTLETTSRQIKKVKKK